MSPQFTEATRSSGESCQPDCHMARKLRSCVYCGGRDDLTADHVPPKAAFPKPRPSDLITVPACSKCNSSFEMDDEYFATILGLRTRTSMARDGRRLTEKVVRGLQRTEADALSDMIAANSIPAGDLPPDYGRVEGSYVYWVNAPRLRATAARIVRGLHFHRYGDRMAVRCRVRAFLLEELSDEERELLLTPLYSAQSVDIANGAFAYRTVHAAHDRRASVWLLTFYADASFVVVTSPLRRRAPV